MSDTPRTGRFNVEAELLKRTEERDAWRKVADELYLNLWEQKDRWGLYGFTAPQALADYEKLKAESK